MNKKHLLLSLAVALGMATPAAAQGRRTPTPNDTLQSVRVLPNGNTVFSIYAPKARKVTLSCEAVNPFDPNSKVITTEQPNGVWTFEVPKGIAGHYRYTFNVDGVTVIDPKSEIATQNRPIAMIENGNEFFSYRKDIPHGAIAVRTYESKEIGTTRTMRVWTPAGYEKGKDKLPVLYLIHGGGDTDTSWPTAGAAGNILDNLLADGKMKPMIVVMPNGTVQGPNIHDEVPIFARDMMTDIIPYIENNYRVLTDKNNRAVAGLSMGGMETLEVSLHNVDKFAYVWVLSSSFNPNKKDLSEEAALLKTIAPDIKKNWKEFVFTQGGPTDIAYNNGKNTRKVFDEAGISYEYMDVEGGHSWIAWRQNLYDLAQRIFKK